MDTKQAQLHTELHNLQQGLKDLSPAVEHIKNAAETTKLAVETAKNTTDAVAKLQAAQTAYYETLKTDITTFLAVAQTGNAEIIKAQLGVFQTNFDKNLATYKETLDVASAGFQKNVNDKLSVVQTATERILSDYQAQTEVQERSFRQINTDISNSLNNAIADFSKNVREQITNVNTTTTKILSEYQAQIEKQDQAFQVSIKILSDTATSIQNTVDTQNKIVETHLAEYQVLVGASNLLIEEIKKVNFSLRLDKIDNTISAINIGIQNTQSKLETLDRKIENFETNLNAINQQNSFFKTLLIGTVVVIIVFGIANLLM